MAQKAIQNVEQKAKEKYEKDIMIMKKQIENDRIAAMKRHAEMEKAMAMKREAEKKALKKIQEKLIQADKENIKSKIEDKNAILLQINGKKKEAEKAALKSISAMKKAVQKVDEAQKEINQIKKPIQSMNIFPRGTKKGQILKWDGTKWALGTDNVF